MEEHTPHIERDTFMTEAGKLIEVKHQIDELFEMFQGQAILNLIGDFSLQPDTHNYEIAGIQQYVKDENLRRWTELGGRDAATSTELSPTQDAFRNYVFRVIVNYFRA